MTTKEFVNTLSKKQDIALKLSKAESPDEAYKIAREDGVTDDQNTFSQEMKAFRDSVGKVSQEEMGMLMGSASTSEIVSAVSTWVGASAAAGSAAA